jgi:GT2 family glycosyltransferase
MTIIVDSSDGDSAEAVVRAVQRKESLPELIYHRSEKGLTKQRNVGLELVSEKVQIVHFVDDDVEMEPGYLDALMQVFLSQPNIVGAGGMVLGGQRKKPPLSAVWGGRESNRPGVVLSSGFNIGAHETARTIRVDWLPGCSMSFRLSAIGDISFDERREGYAIGEDVDFGLKAASLGVLLHVPEARLVHHQSPTNRHDKPEIIRMAVAHRWALARDELGSVRRSMVVYGTLTESVHYLVVLLRKRDPYWWRCSTSALRGLHDIYKARGARP